MTFADLQKIIERRAGQSQTNHSLTALQNLPFWVPDDGVHNALYERTQRLQGRPLCCFNHAIGLPVKSGKANPIFPFQLRIIKDLEKYRRIWIKKSTGIGASELFLRYLAWLCVRHDLTSKPWSAVIVTGPRIELAVGLIERFKNLFRGQLGVTFDTKETVAVVNGCRIEAFPSHHLDAMRSLENPRFMLVDEADFFPKGQQEDVRHVTERYLAKSDPYIVLVSTPDRPGGLFETIERETNSLYHKIFLPWHIGLNLIYTQEEIDQAKQSPSFPREYGLAYLGKVGNVFLPSAIDKAVELGKKYNPDSIVVDAPKSMGVDPAFGSSKFAVVVVQQVDGQLQVIYADQWDKPDHSDAVFKLHKLIQDWQISSVNIDGAFPSIIRALKRLVGERQDYQNLSPEQMRWSKVKPVSFNKEHKEMLGNCKLLIEKGFVAVNPVFDKLITSLRTAVENDGSLDKDSTSYDDIFDAFRLAVKGYRIG